jgi:hypothetical protein
MSYHFEESPYFPRRHYFLVGKDGIERDRVTLLSIDLYPKLNCPSSLPSLPFFFGPQFLFCVNRGGWNKKALSQEIYLNWKWARECRWHSMGFHLGLDTSFPLRISLAICQSRGEELTGGNEPPTERDTSIACFTFKYINISSRFTFTF